MKKTIYFLSILLTGTFAMSDTTETTFEKASFGGGCFWCIEPFFEQLKGVKSVQSGYQGGTVASPTYKEVTSGRTGHAEVVQVVFDPAVIQYSDLLEVFFQIHDPTTLNRQGADIGTQYRSIILTYSEEQKTEAETAVKKLTEKKVFSSSIVTAIEKAGPFYIAEGYHQDYFAKNPTAPYCRVVIAPKMKKIQIREALLKE